MRLTSVKMFSLRADKDFCCVILTTEMLCLTHVIMTCLTLFATMYVRHLVTRGQVTWSCTVQPWSIVWSSNTQSANLLSIYGSGLTGRPQVINVKIMAAREHCPTLLENMLTVIADRLNRTTCTHELWQKKTTDRMDNKEREREGEKLWERKTKWDHRKEWSRKIEKGLKEGRSEERIKEKRKE